jgi:DNA helicase-4
MQQKNTWRSTKWGETFTKTPPWALTLDGDKVMFDLTGKSRKSSIASVRTLSIEPGTFWSSVTYTPDGTSELVVDGIPNADAKVMQEALRSALREYESAESKRQRIKQFGDFLGLLVNWGRKVALSISKHNNEHRWISRDTLQEWMDTRPVQPPNFSFANSMQDPSIKAYFDAQPELDRKVVNVWGYDLREKVKNLNEVHLQAEREACKDFLAKVEKSPLTDDQILAVICGDNRILTIAAAGSGKTSTMVAKAGYAVHRGHVTADRVLLLAFNDKAAKELQKRIVDRLKDFNLPADKIRAQTFHAFGSYVIGQATGKKPSLAPWVADEQDIEHLSNLVDKLKDTDPLFRTNWDLFRMVFTRDLPSLAKEQEAPEDYDRTTKQKGFRTLNGKIVKSHSERLIADWLFYNGVNFEYERAYEHDVADSDHRQYTPDFYYPDIGLYHEHWALDANGNAPAEFKGYVDSMKWKRAAHAQYKTKLIETTSADIRSGMAFVILKKELTNRGVVLDPNPDREVVGRKLIEHADLVKLIRTFLSHAKSNCLTDAQLRERLRASTHGAFAYRHEMFLGLFAKIRTAWETSLKQGSYIDYDDMLNLAADHLEAGHWESPFDLVMVDEFQDSSRARSRLVQALVNKPHKFLFAVGDDWQGINGFAGSDISVMTKFEQWFGKGQTIRLQRTFRCPQSLCDISSSFVLKNPVQIPKTVTSTTTEYPPSVRAIQVSKDTEIPNAVDAVLRNLSESVEAGVIPPSKDGKVSVFVLGRYKKNDAKFLPKDCKTKYGHVLDITFGSIHGSKGLEADYVILPSMQRGIYHSFPSTIVDDPVLKLAMLPSSETYPFSEERRLLYVALTRACRSVTLVTVAGHQSPFLAELAADNGIKVTDMEGNPAMDRICPKCKVGSIVTRNGEYGSFDTCDNFPACDYKPPRPKTSTGTGKKRTTFRKRW